MKKWLLSILFLPAMAFASNALSPPEEAALKFNKWYISELKKEKTPLTDFNGLKDFVTSDTIKALKSLYAESSNDDDGDFPDADMFIKSQDFDDDWNQINIISSDFDAACTNVYVAFGNKKDHVIADCMVKEEGAWKIRSVTLIK